MNPETIERIEGLIDLRDLDKTYSSFLRLPRGRPVAT